MGQKDLYLTELIMNIGRFLEEDVHTKPTEIIHDLPSSCILSQKIIGDYNAFTGIMGDEDALCQFARKYSKFDLTSFDDITKEVLMDFLNLHNGLFTVNLSDSKEIECSLQPPCQLTEQPENPYKEFYQMPVQFDFGIVNFLLAE